MDLIGNIQYVENRFGGRNPNQNKGKLAQKKYPAQHRARKRHACRFHPIPNRKRHTAWTEDQYYRLVRISSFSILQVVFVK